MRLRKRLARLEARAEARQEARQSKKDSGECPPWWKPEDWAERLRLSAVLEQFIAGQEIAPAAGTTQEEIRWMIGTFRAIGAFIDGQAQGGLCSQSERDQGQAAVRAALVCLGAS